MDQLIALIQAHQVIALAVWTGAITFAHHVFDSAVDSLKPPTESSSPQYEFLYNFLNKLAGNYRPR